TEHRRRGRAVILPTSCLVAIPFARGGRSGDLLTLKGIPRPSEMQVAAPIRPLVIERSFTTREPGNQLINDLAKLAHVSVLSSRFGRPTDHDAKDDEACSPIQWMR